MNLAGKIIFFIEKPVVIIVSGDNSELILRALRFFKSQKAKLRVLPFASEFDLSFIVSHSKKVIFIADHLEGKIKTQELVRKLREKDVLLFNFGEEETRGLAQSHKGRSLSYGFLQTPDLTISDFTASPAETNFKIDFQGNIVPLWLKGEWSRKKATALAATIICGLELGLNLVSISQQLKNFPLE